MNKEKRVRVRFAPSPTGPLHLGGIRTALYNYLFAKKEKGDFILRIEDTDQARYVPGAEKYILEALEWLGLKTDEDPVQGGPSKTYRQSERVEIYQKEIKRLLESGDAYYAFDTPEELEKMRERLLSAKVISPKYNTISREFMKNSLVMPKEEVEKLIAKGTPYVIRLKTPHKKNINFFDEVRGWIKVDYTEMEDKVLIKSDGIPTYHFANVVDDYMMKISHVIRGEEWLPSTPVHVLLYEVLGWKNEMPKFIHLPVILKPCGKGKLSKRDTDQLGFPVFPLNWISPEGDFSKGLKESDYLPEAILNFLALMGWNPGTSQEVFSLEQLIENFSLKKIGKSGAKFNIEKAKWFNSQHMNNLPSEYVLERVEKVLSEKKIYPQKIALQKIIKEVISRNNFFDEVANEIEIYLTSPIYKKEDLEKFKITDEGLSALKYFLEKLKNDSENFDVKNALVNAAEKFLLKSTALMPLVRYAISAQRKGIELSLVLDFIGKKTSIDRIESFIKLNEK